MTDTMRCKSKKRASIVPMWKLSKHKYMFILQTVIKIYLSLVAIYVSRFARGVVDRGAFPENAGVAFTKFFALVGLGIVASYCYEYFRTQYATEFAFELRNQCMKRMLHCNYEVIEKEHSGAITNRMIHDINSVAEYISGGFAEAVGSMLMFFCCFVYLLTVNWQMVLTCAICIPITLIFTKKLANPTYKTMEQFEDKMDEIDIMAKDTIMNQKTEKVFQLKDVRRKKFDETMDKATEYYVEYERLVAKASPVKYLLNAAPTLICIMVGFVNSYQGKITSGEFVSVVLLLEYISKPLAEFLTYITDYKTAQVSMERVLEVLEFPLETENCGRKDEIEIPVMADVGSIVEGSDEEMPCFGFKDVTFGYGDTLVLQGINVEIGQGTMVALVGESGSGKSTLMKIMLGLLRVQKGTVSVKGKNIKEWKLEQLRDAIAYVEQAPYLFDGTIEENIKAGNLGATREEVICAAKQAYAHEFIMGFENGYDAEVREGGRNLSGGQRQRIAIARALLKNADILLLDEMTSALDQESEYYIQRTIEQCRKSKTVIVIAHRLKSIIHADEILVLKSGSIVEKGTHEELLEQGQIYRKLYESAERGVERETAVG